ncbi:MAG: hypothetical protein ABI634_12800 [Acidobacteriota bacterium]
MRMHQQKGGVSTDTMILQALLRGPLTAVQLEKRLGLCRQCARPALRVLLATGKVIAEPFEGSPVRKQYRAVRA